MADIRAFVGHSFSEDDAALVQEFLKYFEQLKGVLPSFEWTHAKSAEPKELAQKVNHLISDKNVFVGICTRKERVIRPDKLKTPMFSPDSLQGKDADFAWKTSDWVIQEIGMAVGRSMSLILLLENGCRKPGGLQGDIEFIPFERTHPERAFGPLLEMIKVLSPLAPPPETATTEGPPKVDDAVPDTVGGENEVPDASWDRQKYEDTYFWKTFRDDVKGAAEIEESYLKTPSAKDNNNIVEWKSFSESWKIVLGKGGSFDLLRKIGEDNPTNAIVAKNIAYVLSYLGRYAESAKKYIEASSLADDEKDKRKYLRLAANKMAHNGNLKESVEIMEDQFSSLEDIDEEFLVLSGLKDISEISKDDDLYIDTLERIVQIRPGDFQSRFSLAYKHSEKGNNDLALFHYDKIPVSERSGVTWNNLGVSFQAFSMPANAVRAYQASGEKGETLAMSNLGYKFMQAGFVDEAEAQFGKALAIEGFHKNVGEGIAALRDVFENESKIKEEAFDKAKAKLRFFERLGQAIVKPRATDFEGTWLGPDCALAISLANGLFKAAGSYEREPNALGSGILGLTKKAQKYIIEYEGKVIGHRVRGTVKRLAVNDEGTPTALNSLLLSDNNNEFAMIFDTGSANISVIENMNSTSLRIYELHAS